MKHASKIKKKRHQEHVTKYFYENSKKFEIKNFEYIKDYSKLNLSVDNQKDIKLAKKIAKKFDNYKGRKNLLDKMVNYSMKI
jgi:spore coat polysaccharide biosynthesis protein SpsF (cytidylyltransferase family)